MSNFLTRACGGNTSFSFQVDENLRTSVSFPPSNSTCYQGLEDLDPEHPLGQRTLQSPYRSQLFILFVSMKFNEKNSSTKQENI